MNTSRWGIAFNALLLAMFLLMAFGCQKIIDQEIETSDNQSYSVCIQAEKVFGDTRALSLDGDVLNATWNVGDEVSVIASGTNRGILKAQSSGSTTSLKGTLSGSFSVGMELTLNFLTQDYRNQTGTLSYIASSCDFAQATAQVTAVSDGAISTTPASFVNQQAITKFSFIDKDGQSLSPTSLTISAENGKLVQYYNNDNAQYGDLTIDGNGSVKTIAIRNEYQGKDTYTFFATVGPIVYVGSKKAELENGRYYITSVTLTPYSYNEPEAVDMGVGVLWASANVGATTPEAYGSRFAWGETSAKSTFTWGNYKWFNGDDPDYYENNGYTPSEFTKYASRSGVRDFKFFLDAEDDAANYLMGGEWHTPDRKEWEELLSNCYYHVTTQNNTKGYLLTSKTTGNTIFIPLKSDSVSGYSGSYMSRQLSNSIGYQQNPYYANITENSWLAPRNGDWYYGHGIRRSGYAIRPVKGNICAYLIDFPPNIVLKKGNSYVLTYSIIPETTTNKNVVFTSSNTSVATVSASGSVKGISAGTATITIATSDGKVSKTCEVTVITEPTRVDLGLSVQWAKWDLGAMSSGAEGALYYWGETQPYNDITYFEDNIYRYKWYDYGQGYTKYFSGDALTQLELGDDAVRSTLGSKWRTPTKEEWEELKNNCTWTETTENGVDGYKVSKRNANSTYIFIPKLGYTDDGDAYYYCYMSSTLSSNGQNYIFGMEPWYSGSAIINNIFGDISRNEAHFIRPVYVP